MIDYLISMQVLCNIIDVILIFSFFMFCKVKHCKVQANGLTYQYKTIAVIFLNGVNIKQFELISSFYKTITILFSSHTRFLTTKELRYAFRVDERRMKCAIARIYVRLSR